MSVTIASEVTSDMRASVTEDRLSEKAKVVDPTEVALQPRIVVTKRHNVRFRGSFEGPWFGLPSTTKTIFSVAYLEILYIYIYIYIFICIYIYIERALY